MNYGPAGYDDNWDEDEFDFGEYQYADTEYSTGNFYASEHVKSQTFAPKTTSNVNPQAKQATSNSKISFGRGRGRGFSAPPQTQNTKLTNNTEKKNLNENIKGEKGQGNFLFGRTKRGQPKTKQHSEEKNSGIAEDLRAVISKGDTAMVLNILNQGISVDYILKTGWTGLMHAANCGRHDVVVALIERGANVNFQKDMFTVLMAACSSDCDIEKDLVQCVSHLIEKGAKINCHDRYHMTPLMYACRNGRAQIVDVLLRHKSDINKQDQRGWSALSWAASRGHGRVVRMLLDSNANPKQYTNDGQSAEDLAYDGGFTIIANILNVAINPRQVEHHTPSTHESGSLNEEGDCLRYGDLELFLFGLELGHLVPLFQEQRISFDAFLQLTDADLQQIGVSQIGIRKKILTATHDVHTKEWDLSSLPSKQMSSQFSSEGMNLVLANVEKHLLYIQCSVGYARKSLLSMEDPGIVVQDEKHAQQFLDRTKNVLKAASGITEEVSRLESGIKKISSTVPCSAADLIGDIPETNAYHNRSLFLPVMFIGTCAALGLATVYLRQDS